jgi:4-amino-4-deoxy-L-arabinose transferase-like glycosyltransferase
MSTSSVPLPFRLSRGRSRMRSRTVALPRPELALLLVLAAVLNLWALSTNGFANDYYSAAVRSMSTSWHAFLYGSFDASGVMTVDKPPLALWVEALSVRVFGFSSWSLLVPQALMGIATVALAYDLTRRRFGRAAGFAAGLALATTPITVAISRHNNPDALLVLCVTAALWFVVRGLEDGRSRWIILSGVCVGLGFEAKMGAALLVVPAIVAAWLWVAPRGRRTALRQLAAGGAAMTAVGLAWPLLVTLTPASNRPWIAGTSDNSIWSLILGYNGFGRLLGQSGGPGGAAAGPGGGGGGGGNIFFGGTTGPLRLLNTALGGQDGWLLGLALVAGVAVVVASRLRRGDARTGWIIAVGGTFLMTAVAFSTAQGIFHPYYVSQLAPFTAALVGAGAWQLTRSGRAVRVLGPLAIAGGVAAELVVLHENPGQLTWLPAVLIGGGILAAVALAGSTAARVRTAAVSVAFAVLLLAPGTWAVQTLGHPTNGTFPAGGPQSAGMDGPGGRGGPGGPGGNGRGGGRFGQGGGRFAPGGGGFPPGAGAAPGAPPAGAPPQGAAGGFGRRGGGGMFGGNSQALTQAVSYAQQHGGGTVAVSSQTSAAGQLIASGADVAGIGGFSGRESQVTVTWLANAIDAGHIRWVLTDGGSGGMAQDSRVGSSAVMAAVAKVCTPVSSVTGLYDCSNSAAALRALGT